MTTPTPIAGIDLHELAGRVKRVARELGFDLVGIAPAEPSRYRDYLRQWLDTGQAGTMQWMHSRFDERTDVRVYLPGAASVICVAMNYNVPLESPPRADRNYHGRIARYALGEDYHQVIKDRLYKLADWLRDQAPQAQTRACVDTAPVMEKELAARAGVGWIGKNTCVIHPQTGSWLLLGEVLTTLPLPADNPRSTAAARARDASTPAPPARSPRPTSSTPADAFRISPSNLATTSHRNTTGRSANGSSAATSARTCARGTARRRWRMTRPFARASPPARSTCAMCCDGMLRNIAGSSRAAP